MPYFASLLSCHYLETLRQKEPGFNLPLHYLSTTLINVSFCLCVAGSTFYVRKKQRPMYRFGSLYILPWLIKKTTIHVPFCVFVARSSFYDIRDPCFWFTSPTHVLIYLFCFSKKRLMSHFASLCHHSTIAGKKPMFWLASTLPSFCYIEK